MTVLRNVLIVGGVLGLAACESLPALPGSTSSSQPAASTPDPQPQREDPRNGIAGAALCIASAFYLADAELMSEDQAQTGAEVWTSIIEVIPAAEGERQAAVDSAYAALQGLDAREQDAGLQTALDQYSEGGNCVDQQFQRDYLTRFGDPALMDRAIQGGGQ